MGVSEYVLLYEIPSPSPTRNRGQIYCLLRSELKKELHSEFK